MSLNQGLSLNLWSLNRGSSVYCSINQSNDPTEIKSFLDNTIDLEIKNLKIAKIENYLKISFETINLKESISIADEIASMLNKDFSKVTYSKNEKGSVTELFIINP